MLGRLFRNSKKENVYAPISGRTINITDVPDPVFSQKMMGEGIAIDPDIRIQTIVAPVAGKIVHLAATKHAFGIRSILGEDILVHVGLDTVELKGKGFENLVEEGDKVKAGQPIERVDFAYIGKQGKGTVVPIVITNTAENKFMFNWCAPETVMAGESLILVSKRHE